MTTTPLPLALASLLLVATSPALAQDPPATDVYLVSLDRNDDGTLKAGTPRNVTARPGYDNQPSFLPDGRRLLYTAIDGGQADVWVYDLETAERRRLTATAESEYSPTPIPGEDAISVVRVEADGRQRLWRFPLAGGEPELLLPDVVGVGYHAWADGENLALFVLGEPPALHRARRGPGPSQALAENVGRALHRVPGSREISFVHKQGKDEGESAWTIKKVDLETGKTEDLGPTRPRREDYAWSPSGELWTGDGGALYVRDPAGGGGWRVVADFSELGISDVTRLAVHPDGRLLAFVAAEKASP